MRTSLSRRTASGSADGYDRPALQDRPALSDRPALQDRPAPGGERDAPPRSHGGPITDGNTTMVVATSILNLALDALAVATSGVFVVLMWRRRTEPAARPLLGMAVVLLVGSLVHTAIVDLQPTRAAIRSLGALDGPMQLWFAVELNLVALCAGFWAVFSFRYTGRFERVSAVVVALVVGLVAVVLGITVSVFVAPEPFTPSVETVARTVNLASVGLVSMGAIGVFLLFAAALRYDAFPLRQASLFSAGTAVFFLGVTYAGIYRTAIAVPILTGSTAGLFSIVVARYRLFETLPVATVVGRDRVIDEMTEGIVVVDRDGEIRDLNPAAEAILDVDRTAVLGEHLSSAGSFVPDPETLSTVGDPARIQTADDRAIVVTADRVTDARGRAFGHLLVCRDVTDRRTREQRLTVLNQLLVGAVRERMDAVADAAATLPDPETDRTAVADRIWTTTTNLTTLVARARDVERTLAAESDRAAAHTDVTATVREVLAEVTPDGRSPELESPTDPVVTSMRAPLLTAVLQTLFAGAFETTDTPVTATVTRGGSGDGEIRLDGDRPSGTVAGADDSADTVADLAVEIARLAVEYAGGKVSVTDRSERRSVVVRVPEGPASRRAENVSGVAGSEGGERA